MRENFNTRKAKVFQLLGFVPPTTTGALPLDHAGNFPQTPYIVQSYKIHFKKPDDFIAFALGTGNPSYANDVVAISFIFNF